jgi:hypothetical protein
MTRIRRGSWMRVGTVVLGAACGVALGSLSVHAIFSGSALVLIPWAIGCLLIGSVVRHAVTALVASAAFGFAVSFTFLVDGYAGDGPLVAALGIFCALAGLGAVVAAAVGLAANRMARLLARRRRA